MDGNPYEPPQPIVASQASRLFSDQAFWGLSATQFLGAFNDNLFKQTILLMFVAVPLAQGSSKSVDLQWLGTFCFSLPFILFSGYGGFLSDRHPKRSVIVSCKIAEIVIMGIGVGLFAYYSKAGLPLLLVGLISGTLLLMGAQSAFFGPGKYGILPEMLRERDIPQANGFLLMTTFLAIILGSALAGLLLTHFEHSLWIVGLACVGIAITGTATSFLIRGGPAAQPHLPFEWSATTIPVDIRQLLRRDRSLLAAIAAGTVFWMTAAMVQMSVNALGKLQLQVSDWRTSILVASISAGIAVGSLVAGIASGGKFNARILKLGCYGLIACLAMLSLPGWNRSHLLGYTGSLLTLIAMGVFTGMFALPLQVYVQTRPPADCKGRMIATQNLLNWVGITMSAALYFAAGTLFAVLQWPPCATFAVSAAMMSGVALFYRPQSDGHECHERNDA